MIAGVHRVVSAQFKCCSFILLPVIVARRFVGPQTLVKINSSLLECAGWRCKQSVLLDMRDSQADTQTDFTMKLDFNICQPHIHTSQRYRKERENRQGERQTDRQTEIETQTDRDRQTDRGGDTERDRDGGR